jgi:perosamine synthetase
MEFARAKELVVIEDCAHAAGSVYKNRKLGRWGYVSCFSFEEKKCMTTGDGGMICLDNEALEHALRAYRWVGIDKDTWKRVEGYTRSDSRDAMHWYYEISVLGYKYNMNDLAAAIGLAQLKKLDWMNTRRSQCIKRYMNGMEGLKKIELLLPYEPDEYAYWMFGIRCHKRDELIIRLKSKGIATGVHYMPLTLHPLFKPYNTATPVSKEIWKTFITLPLHADLTDEEIDYIVDAVQEFDRG